MTMAHDDSTAVPTELVRGRGGGGPAPKRIVVAYGFWIFILSDIVMFSGLFAAYAVLSGNTAGGPTGAELFNLHNVFIETMCLLLSSYTCGLGALSAERRQPGLFLIFAASHSCSARPFSSSRSGNLPAWSRTAPAPRAAAFCPPSSPWSARTACTSPAAWSGSSIWSRRLSSRACGPPCSGACCAGACSGTRWTSSGSGYSPWFI